MRFNELTEGKNVPTIIVDVQPAYASAFDDQYLDELAQFIAGQKAPILMFVNADESGLTEDNVEYDILPWWEEIFERNGLDFYEQGYDKMEFFDKGYGYFRAWMDSGVPDELIIKMIRELYQQKESDSRMLFGGDDSEDYIERMNEFLGTDQWESLYDDNIAVEWTSVKQLKEYAGYVCGGGRNECLREVTLLMNAFNIRHKLIEKFIY